MKFNDLFMKFIHLDWLIDQIKTNQINKAKKQQNKKNTFVTGS